MADLKGLRLDSQTLILLAVIVALLGIGYGIGTYKGAQSVQSQIIDQGSQVQLSGTVQSADDNGFTVKVDNSAAGGAGGTGVSGGTGSQAQSGTWTVKYGKQGANVTSNTGTGAGTGSQQLKKGDKVQVSGTPIGKHSLVAQTVSKILPPTPSPKASPAK